VKRTRLLTLLACSSATLLAACEATLSMTTADAGALGDAGSFDAGSVDAFSTVDAFAPGADAPLGDAPSGPARVGVFVASGQVGRTLVSCDDGRSWNHDQTERFVDEMGAPLPTITRCYASGMDCDHHPGSTKGVIYAQSWFFRTTGWGPAGHVTRSRNGIVWESITERTTFGGLAHDGNATLIAGTRTPQRSTNEGTTWAPSENEAIPGWNVRRTGRVAGPDGGASGGLFIIVGNDGTEVGLSSDGLRWRAPTSIDAACGRQIQGQGGIARVGRAIVIAGGEGSVCRSTDEGMTWTLHALPDDARASSSALIATSTEFMLWTNGALLRSPDGMTWTRTATEPSIEVGAVARSPEGTFVAVRGGWAHWYDQQRFYRSTDGVRWETLDNAMAPQGHPVLWIAWGQVDAASACRD
jgi:hypothetical protein